MTPKDYEYFKSKGFYDTPEVLGQVRPISGIEDGRMSCQMRLIAFEEMLSRVDGPPAMTKRGERSKFFHMIGSKPHTDEENKPKKSFSLFKKSK